MNTITDLPKLVASSPISEAEEIIDRLLHMTENQHILRELRRGAPFAQAVGACGGSGDGFFWSADSRGIEFHPHDEESWDRTKRISPQRIIDRAMSYAEEGELMQAGLF